MFEGIDGSGKTTQIKLATQYLCNKLGNANIATTKDLGGSLLGENLRHIMYHLVPPRDMAPGVLDLMFLTGHVQNWHTLVEPWLDCGKTVLSDRWWLSQFTYVVGRKFHPDVLHLYAKMRGGWPDLTIFLHGDTHKLLARANARADAGVHQHRKDWNDADVQKRVCDRYFELYTGFPGWVPVCVDDRDEEQVWKQVKHEIDLSLELHSAKPRK